MVGNSASVDKISIGDLAVGFRMFHVEHFVWNIKKCVNLGK